MIHPQLKEINLESHIIFFFFSFHHDELLKNTVIAIKIAC